MTVFGRVNHLGICKPANWVDSALRPFGVGIMRNSFRCKAKASFIPLTGKRMGG